MKAQYKKINLLNKIINPVWSVAFLIFIALLSMVFHMPEEAVLILILIYFSVIVFSHPVNGIYFLLIIIPFALGNSKRPFYIVLECLVYIIILSSVLHMDRKESKSDSIPYKRLVIIFFLFSLLSLPLDLKQLYYEIRGEAFNNPVVWLIHSFRKFSSGNEGNNLYWLRSISNLFSGISLYFVTTYFIKDKQKIERSFFPVWLISVIVVVVGYVFLYDIIPHNGTYLSLSLVGQARGRMTAFAYNEGYLGQYLIVALPFVAFYLNRWRENKIVFFAATGTVLLLVLTIPQTLQRGVVIALFSQFIIFSFYYFIISQNKKKVILRAFLVIFSALILMYAVDHFVLKDQGSHRIINEWQKPGLRFKQWAAAMEMFKVHPVLGIGFGKYHYFFPKYCKLAGFAFKWKFWYVRTTAHNLYLHILAERGALGLLSFLLLMGCIFKDIFKNIRKMEPSQRSLIIALSVSLWGWLTYGLTQYMFYLRSMELFFWIMLGFLAVLLRDYIKPVLIIRKIYIGIGAAFVALLVYRFWVVYHYVV